MCYSARIVFWLACRYRICVIKVISKNGCTSGFPHLTKLEERSLPAGWQIRQDSVDSAVDVVEFCCLLYEGSVITTRMSRKAQARYTLQQQVQIRMYISIHLDLSRHGFRITEE